MSLSRLLLLAALIAALIAVQIHSLNPSEEWREENLQNRTDLPASSAVPTYLSSLFLGPLRPLMVDFFWMELEKLRESHRYFEARQLMDMITWMQPRNPEIWVILAHDLAYNIPEGYLTTPDEKWESIREGYLKYLSGAQNNPTSAYLRYEVASNLIMKMTITRDGRLQEDLIRRIEGDDELQHRLQERPQISERLSPFLLAVLQLEKGRDILLQTGSGSSLTHMGFLVREDYFYTWPHHAYFYEAYYQHFYRGDTARAVSTLKKASDQARLASEKFKNRVTAIHQRLAEFYPRLIPILEIDQKLRSGTLPIEEFRKQREELFRLAEKTLSEGEGLDAAQYIRYALLDRLKQTLVVENQGIEDSHEYDDLHDFVLREDRHRLRPGGDPEPSTIAPFLTDVDIHVLEVPADIDQDGHDVPSPPRTVTLLLQNDGSVPLRLRIEDRLKKEIIRFDLEAATSQEFTFPAAHPGAYFALVEAREPADVPSPSSRYRLKWIRTDPPVPGDGD